MSRTRTILMLVAVLGAGGAWYLTGPPPPAAAMNSRSSIACYHPLPVETPSNSPI